MQIPPVPRVLVHFAAPAGLAAVFLLACTLPSVSAAESLVVQPEVEKVNDDVMRQLDDNALGGEYVIHRGDYQPLASIRVEEVEGDPLVVWARLRGVAVQLKTIVDGQQKERNWSWAKPADWTWVKLGSVPRADAGEAFLIIRGPGAKENAGLDAVLVTSDGQLDPSALSPEELEKLQGE
ncbi:MAG: hypothetical protein SFU53_05795 [Terrimicrobiaceae bacterium]|nr:hypothetical protein [Terrimicrobiaceae bacterium]